MIKKKFLPLYNETMNELFSAERFSKSEMAQNRLKVVDFSKAYDIICKNGEYKGILIRERKRIR
jgi:hypothetical protein